MMKEAGFTVGGFYKHFASRDGLVAEALASALEMWKRQVNAATSGRPPVTYESLVHDYLSEVHRNHPGTGCPVSALAGDIARSDKQTRALVTRKIRDNIELIANLVRDTSQPDKRAKGKRQTDQGVVRAHAIPTYCRLCRRNPRHSWRGGCQKASLANVEACQDVSVDNSSSASSAASSAPTHSACPQGQGLEIASFALAHAGPQNWSSTATRHRQDA
jgi:AcrR family transcriptional regulator